MTSLLLGLAALALAMAAMPAEMRSRFRAEPVLSEPLHPSDIATARGLRDGADGAGGAVSTSRKRN
ncbi:hypothetical protein [Paragemmobacter straminiformis]|uniref:Uncharacterized protein n=1 Tax=Paragemmobacter straminiformis TaxID=2045119 RepID=A0A842I4C8_9RHOB|nr:hypothetical protein [Gemmobacter straminiformis]MBC2834431.1 hypothetical protein [Gemmobacter straminiformis]